MKWIPNIWELFQVGDEAVSHIKGGYLFLSHLVYQTVELSWPDFYIYACKHRKKQRRRENDLTEMDTTVRLF